MRRAALLTTIIFTFLSLGAGPAEAHHRPGPCDIHWWRSWTESRNVEPIKDLIRCAARKWPVPGGASKALSVASCESGFRPDATSPSGTYRGVYQQANHYWPGRYREYTRTRWRLFESIYNGRTNVIVSIRMAHRNGWGDWEMGACA